MRLRLRSHTRSFLHILLVKEIIRATQIHRRGNSSLDGVSRTGRPHWVCTAVAGVIAVVFIIYCEHGPFMPASRPLALVEAAAATWPQG